MKKIVIINAYGAKNTGDECILESSLSFIKQALPKNKISVLCEQKKSILSHVVGRYNLQTHQLPYGYAIRSTKGKTSEILKGVRFIEIFTVTYLLITLDKLNLSKLPQSGFYSYISAIKDADMVIGMGGGYLSTKGSLKDYFGLLLTILPINISKIYKKPILFLPISFGGFANTIHEKLAFNALKGTKVFLREEISFKRLKKLKKKSDNITLLRAPDIALFYGWKKKISIEKKIESNYIVLTAREWMGIKKQKAYEKSLCELIDYAWEKYKLKTIFIPMASNKIEDDDNRVAQRISKHIIHKHAFTIFKSINPKDVQQVLSLARLAVCTRLHSAILATTVSTPFITISYNLKTDGFLKSYDLSKWNTDIETTNFNKIKILLDHLLRKKEYNQFISRLKSKDLLPGQILLEKHLAF